jgi:hypothetical protein
MARQQALPMRHRLLFQNRIEHRGQRRAVGEPRRVGGETRIGAERRVADAIDENRPEFGQLAHDEHPAIGGAEHLAGGGGGVRRSRRARRGVAFVHIPERRIAGLVDGGRQQIGIDIAPLAAALGIEKRGEQPDRHYRAGHEIDHRQPHPLRLAIGVPGQRAIAGLGLHQIVIARPTRACIVAAIGRQMGADDGGVVRAQRGMGQPQFFGKITAQIVGDGVGARHQPVEHRLAFRGIQIERQRAFVEIK